MKNQPLRKTVSRMSKRKSARRIVEHPFGSMRGKDQQARYRLAGEAARIMAEEGVENFHTAKQKAAARLGITQTRNLPSNEEIEQALISYQRLFLHDEQNTTIRHLRRQALKAMKMLAPFQPRLTGNIASGTANKHATVSLHVFTDNMDDVTVFLINHKIPFRSSLKKLTFGRGREAEYPCLQFVAGDTNIEVTILPRNGLRQPPLGPIDGKPIKRLTLEQLRQLIEPDDS